MVSLAKRMLASRTPGTLATLFSASGSTYRPLGSMTVSLPGARAGGVTGGRLEEYVARIGERNTRETPTLLLHFGTDSNADEYAPALGCGGSVDLLVERLTAEHLALLEQYESVRRRDECSLLVCTVRQTCGAIAVTRTWSSESAEYTRVSSDAQSFCQAVMRQRISRHARLDSNTEALVHYVLPPPLCQYG